MDGTALRVSNTETLRTALFWDVMIFFLNESEPFKGLIISQHSFESYWFLISVPINHTSTLLGFLFYPEDGGSRFL